MRMKTISYVLTITALTCTLGVAQVNNSSAAPASEDTSQSLTTHTARPIPTIRVAAADNETIRMFPGTVKARNNVDLAFSIEGPLVELNGREGRFVRQGEVLAKLDERDFRNAFEAAKARHMRAAADFQRARVLFERKVISQAEFDATKAASDVALAEYKISEKALEDTVITAPYDGVIAKRYIENREHVKKQVPILALKDISEVEVIIQVPERFMAQEGINHFTDIRVRFDVGGERWFKGEVREYSVQADPVTRTYEVAVRLQAPIDLAVLPGMTATVQASLDAAASPANEQLSTVSLIPVESVYSASDGKTYTWVIPEKSGNPQKVEVHLGTMSDGKITVLSGLKPGIRIAIAGIHSLTEDMIVRPMNDGGEGLDG